MATLRGKAPPVGSAQWVANERTQASQFIDQETEDFAFSVRNDLEWLNEHMADIFSKTQLNVTDIFKTPGKIRGKTPRTARKKNPLEAREPLSDIFAPNPQSTFSSSPPKNQFQKNIEQFQVAQDVQKPEAKPTKAVQGPFGFGKENVDSGYHGSQDDAMDIDLVSVYTKQSPIREASPSKREALGNDTENEAEKRRVTDESFVSAREAPGSKNHSITDDVDATIPDENMAVSPLHRSDEETSEGQDQLPKNRTEEMTDNSEPAVPGVFNDEEDDHDDVRSPSDGSSPVKPLVRKSSLTFASLPAREPLAKKSIGARVSRVSYADLAKFRTSQRLGPESPTHLGRFTGGKSLGASQHSARNDNSDDAAHGNTMELDEPVEKSEDPVKRSTAVESSKAYSMTSTQRLHERINMLGKAKEPRLSKSIAANHQTQPTYPQLPSVETDGKESVNEQAHFVFPPKEHRSQTMSQQTDIDEDEDDWIKPIGNTTTVHGARPQLLKSQTADVMEGVAGKTSIGNFERSVFSPQGSPMRLRSPQNSSGSLAHTKAASVSVFVSPSRPAPLDLGHKKAISVSNPDMPPLEGTTTPAGSPNGRRYPDGPLSASKAKFFSVLKSAKERLIASAGISAQAKMEALSPVSSTRLAHQTSVPSIDQVFSPKRDARAALGQALPNASQHTFRSIETTASPVKEGRRTRSSSEREREREKEDKKKEKAVREQQKLANNLEKAREKVRQEAAAHTQKARSVPQAPTISTKPSAETVSSYDEPNQSADEMPAPPQRSLLPTAPKPRDARRLVKPTKDAAPKQPVVVKVAMNRHPQHQPSSSTLSSVFQDAPPAPPPKQQQVAPKGSADSFKSSVSSHSTKQRPLDPLAKKREQEKATAQRKAEQKREQEQRRLRLEEDRKAAEQQRKAAEQRLQEAKKAAAQRSARQQQPSRPPSRQGNNLASALQHEKAHAQHQHQRADLGTARPVSRLVQDTTRPTVPPMNPAKPPKRALNNDDDELASRPALQRAAPSYQQLDSKRRKTDEIEPEPVESRASVMKPPIRQSNIRKEQSKFGHGYMTAPTPSQNPMLKAAVTAQQMNKSAYTQQFASGKIPFAEATNPPAASANNNYHGPYKTPSRTMAQPGMPSTAKSSPHYPPSEQIALPDIATDSEDEEDDGFSAPSWTDSPALRELLSQQQLVDPEQIFGPIAPLQMEEVFKNKDRHKKFRDRTSSAVWNFADRLTEDERAKDREGREKLIRDGGWTYGSTSH